MRSFELKFSFCLLILAITVQSIFAQNFTRPNVDYLQHLYVLEEDYSIALNAKQLAVQEGLPVNIFIPQTMMAEPAGVENSQVFYTVYLDLKDYKSNGFLAFYDEIEALYDLTSAYMNMGNGTLINEDIFLSQFSTAGLVAQGGDGIILIPESSNDRVMSFDRMSGDLVDLNFIPDDPTNLSTPVSARPDNSFEGPVYLSDQIDDVVQLYDENTGSYIGQFAPPGPGKNTAILDNIRGIAFRNDNNNLLVTIGSGSNSDAIAEFDQNGNYLGNFIANGAGGMDSPFDVMYYEFDNTYLTNGITSDDILKFDQNGNFISTFNNTDVLFPEQMLELPNGGLLVADFTVDAVLVFDNTGSLQQTVSTPSFGGHRGVYTLGNGNYLITTGSGVHEIGPNGAFVRTVVSGVSGRYIHEYGSNACLTLPLVDCPQDQTFNLDGGQCSQAYNYSLGAFDTCGNTMDPILDSTRIELVNGFESGSELPIGTHIFEINIYNSDLSDFVSCTWEVTVNEFPNPIQSLGCNDNVQISLNEDCEAYVGADDILEGGPYACYDNYQVDIATDQNFNNIISTSLPGEDGAYINNAQVGQSFYARVTDPASGNSCWGQIHIEDKLIPELSCTSLEIPCLSNALPGVIYGESDSIIPFPVPGNASISPSTGSGPFTVSGFDPCGDVTLNFNNQVQTLDCDSIYSSIIYRNWTAVDESGNSTSCQDTIFVVRPTLSDVILPPNYDGFDEAPLSCNGQWDEGCIPGFQNRPGQIVDPEEGNQYPDPCETGLVNAQLCDNIYSTYEDQLIEACGGSYKIIRKFVFLDWCTGEIINHQQLIKVVDDVPPIIDCPATITVSVSANPDDNCLASFDVPDITDRITDECSPSSISYTVNSSAGTIIDFPPSPSGIRIVGLPIGTHTLTYTADDGCGNTTTCVQILEVIDAVEPVAICDQNTSVVLGADGEARVYWNTIEDGSYDNCGIDRIELRRMNPASNDCEVGADDDWKPYIDFCCEDLSVDSVVVLFRVTDLAGNQNTCMVFVRVDEKIRPIIQAPADITLSCTYDFNVLDLDDPNDRTFGSIVDFTKGEVRDTTFIFDEAYETECLGNRPYDPTKPTHTIVDGYVTDNCNIREVGIFFDDGRDQCGRGFIIRAFRAEDFSGNSEFDFQRITFVNCDPFTEDDIIWPRQYDGKTPSTPILTCEDLANDSTSADPTPQGTGVPRFNNEDECAVVAVRVEDEVFDVVQDACFKIFRHWEVLDWCSFDSDSTQPWTYTQVIKVKDTEAPILQACDDVTICDSISSNCLGRVELVQPVDDCTPDEYLKAKYIIEPFNDDNDPADDIVREDLTVEEGEVNLFEMLPFGTHKLTWIVEDMCGQVGTCEYLITVEDCKIPTPYCLNGLVTVVMPATGEIKIFAEDLDAGSFDNCGPVQFSFTSDIADSCLTVTCDDIRTSPTIEVEIWVTDQNGNQDYCVTYVRVQDPNDICPGNASIWISGNTHLLDGRGVSGVNVTLNSDNIPTPIVKNTVANGFYRFNVEKGENYELGAFKNDDVLNGVSTWDIALIQKHILNLELIEHPFLLIAANVNDDDKISGADILELRRVILGIEPEFSNNNSWRFLPAEIQLPANVLPQGYIEHISVNAPVTNIDGQDFESIKIGDIDGSVKPSELRNEREANSRSSDLVFKVNDSSLKSGEVVELVFNASGFENVMGFQFTLGFDPASLHFQGLQAGELNVSDENVGVFEDKGSLTMSWNDIKGRFLQDDDRLFTLRFTAEKEMMLSEAIDLNSSVTPIEAYVNREKVNIQLQFVGEQKEFALYQNTPNPFRDETIIGFDLPSTTEAQINIYNSEGKIVKQVVSEFEKGYNQVRIDNSELTGNGIYYYELITDGYTASKKMIKINP